MLLAINLEQIQSQAFPPEQSLGSITPAGIVSKILPYVFGAAGILLLIYLVTAGISMMLSRGDPKAMQAAQAKITNALVGFFIVFLSYVIVRLVGQILGLEGTLFSQIFGGD